MNVSSSVFCVVTLALTFVITWLLFPFAAMTPDEVQAARTPVEAELMDDVTLPDFGDVPVLDMVLHYIDNPPLESSADTGKVRFQGC